MVNIDGFTELELIDALRRMTLGLPVSYSEFLLASEYLKHLVRHAHQEKHAVSILTQ